MSFSACPPLAPALCGFNVSAPKWQNAETDSEIVGEITVVETIAAGKGIRDLKRLRRNYGKGRWRKMKGTARIRLVSGRIRIAELHEAVREIYAGPKAVAGTLQVPFPSAEMWRKRRSEQQPDARMLVVIADQRIVGHLGAVATTAVHLIR